MSVCRGCRAEIRWVKTTAGKSMPIDPKPMRVVESETGSLKVVLDDGSVAAARPALPEEDGRAGWTSHFATCSKANDLRKGSR